MAAQRKYPDELRERAVKMVFEIRGGTGKGMGSSPGWYTSAVDLPLWSASGML